MYVTDMTHFAGVEELVGAKFNGARRFAAYLGAVVAVATANPPGAIIQSALACRRRPGRQPCPGRLVVRRSEAPRQISWACPACDPACDEEGVISNFEQSTWDPSPPLSTEGEEKAALLSVQETARPGPPGHRRPAPGLRRPAHRPRRARACRRGRLRASHRIRGSRGQPRGGPQTPAKPRRRARRIGRRPRIGHGHPRDRRRSRAAILR